MLVAGVPLKFDLPKTVSLAYPGGVVYAFQGVVSVFKDENGTIHLKKNNDNIVEIVPGYVFIEIGEVDDE